MFYANVDLGGGTYAFKKRFLKMVENHHSYYMPNFAGMCDGPYKETQADHHVYIRISDKLILNRILNVLGKRYDFHPVIHEFKKDEEAYGREGKTYEQLEYNKTDYIGREYYEGSTEEEED